MRLWYDDQCEVCQAGVAWLRWLDHGRGRVDPIPLSLALTAEASAPPGISVDDLLRNLHVVTPGGQLRVGARAVAALARLFPLTWPAGALASIPGLSWIASGLYRWIAANRYSLSRCRGGVCRSVRQDIVRQKAGWLAFQACRFVGWGLIAPLATALFILRLGRQCRLWLRTRNRSARLLEGRLSIHFLGGGISSAVSLLFGELFTMTRYGSLIVDPGGTRLWRSAARHLRRLGPMLWVAPTHAHEEHVGNLEKVALASGARILAHPRSLPLLKAPCRIGFMRSLVIGQPRPVALPVLNLPEELRLDDTLVQVVETPGHCADHISLYIPRDRLLLAGDAFMGTHFSSPNDDVDHTAWIAALERLLTLDIDVIVEAHGHVHSVREDVLRDLEAAGLACVASRQDPRALLERKLDFLRWVGAQVAAGALEGLPNASIQATVFPWTQRWSYESAMQDALAGLVSGRAFGRHKLVRSFRPAVAGQAGLPAVYELRW